MDVLKNKKALLAALVAVAFVGSAIFVVLTMLAKRPKGETTWQLNGARIDNEYTIKGWSEKGFDGNQACMRLENRGEHLTVTVKKVAAGPPGVYEEETCQGEAAPGGSGRNGLLRLARIEPCVTGLILRPGAHCSLGVKLVAGGRPGGELDISTEVMCPSREIPPCQLLREDLKPTAQKPLALTVDQKSGFPKSDSGFKVTTQKAELTAVEAEPGGETSPTGPLPGTPGPGTESGPGGTPGPGQETGTAPPVEPTPPEPTQPVEPGSDRTETGGPPSEEPPAPGNRPSGEEQTGEPDQERTTPTPDETTQGPGETTQGPGETTQGPDETTQGPGETTQGPDETTQGPGETTQGPDEMTPESEQLPGQQDPGGQVPPS
ncbi:hypothetical protein ABGB12_04935 [Actinocorallia sp. B10E7]|uniref:hypothetical protein n=1 Tax=Actinocorallia sp. B10E7 TaxID=3153558 RepID=UPI00325E28E5